MPTEAQRIAMLAAMGIDVYRLRMAPAGEALVRVGVDAQARVCMDGRDGESAERLFAMLPAALGVARERVRSNPDAGAANDVIVIDASAVRGDAQAKRALWSSLKPLARRLQAS